VKRREQRDGYCLEYLDLDLNGIESVPAILLLPDQRPAKAPAMLYCHAHFGTYEIGKDELVSGRSVMPAYAPVFAEKGIVGLAIDSWCFGERNHARGAVGGELDTFKRMLWHGQVLFRMMMFDLVRALDYLASRPDVDSEKIGAMGLSMGATHSWWLAALDERIRLCLDLCCLTDYQALMDAQNLTGHGVYYYVPHLLKHFDAAAINELIAPRARLSLNGCFDDLTPPAGVERIRHRWDARYRELGAERCCRIGLFECAHEETHEMRLLVLDCIERWLLRR
jgi:cephalosporin-C deacetylase-like acetyl esterase